MSRLIGHFTSFYITYSAFKFRPPIETGQADFNILQNKRRFLGVLILSSSFQHKLPSFFFSAPVGHASAWNIHDNRQNVIRDSKRDPGSRIQGNNTGNAGNLSAIDDFEFKSVTEYQGTDFIKRQRIGMLLLSQWAAGLLSEQMSRTPLRVSIFLYWCERDQRAECREQWAESF